MVAVKATLTGVKQEKMIENATLTPRQLRAINALLTHPTVAAAAVVLGVAPSTIYRWLGENAFRAALAQAEGEAVAAAGRKLVNLAESALNVLSDVMTDPQAPDAVRVRAAETVLANLMKFREVIAFETRLADLEREVRGDDA